MDQLTTVFRADKITNLHRTRIREIRSILAPRSSSTSDIPSGSGLDYAIAHHFLEGAELAANHGNHQRFAWYRANLISTSRPWFEMVSDRSTLLLAPDRSMLQHSPIADTPYYLLGPETSSAPNELIKLADDARNLATTYGFDELVDQYAPIICLLEARSLGDPLNSWTITRLPGTVFLDHSFEPYFLARDLIHEAGHNWLNDALTAHRVTISDCPGYYSPWKNTIRPAFGFLHACWAFPLTVLFTARALDHTTGQLRTYLSTYLDQQRTQLAATNDSHREALTLITDDDLRERLHLVHREAQAL